jgi:hypothetical protein
MPGFPLHRLVVTTAAALAIGAVLLSAAPALAQDTPPPAGVVVLDDGRACPMQLLNGMPSPLGLYPNYVCGAGDWLLGTAPEIGGHMLEWLSNSPQLDPPWTFRQVTIVDKQCTYDMSSQHADWHVVCP